MGMTDNLREGLGKRKTANSGEQELRELINQASTKAMKKFIQRLDQDEIPIDNMSDFIRILGAYKEINGIDAALEGNANGGALPQLNMRQEAVIEKQITEGKLIADEEGRVSVGDMSQEDMTELIKNFDREQNKANEQEF